MKTLDEREEAQLLDAIKRAVDLVDNKGMTPSEAIEKVARDDKMTPGTIKVVCAAYNTGRQTAQREAHTNILDKLASFPLADSDAVIKAIYHGPTEAEKRAAVAVHADYAAPPSWLRQPNREKLASAPVSLVDKPLEPLKPNLMHTLNRAYGSVAKAKQAADEASRQASAAEDRLRKHVAELVTYFRKSASYRLPFQTVEKAAYVYFGGVVQPLMQIAYERSRLREKRASADYTIQRVPIDLNAEPFSIIRDCVKAAEDVNRLRAFLKVSQEKLASTKEEAFRPFSQAGLSNGHGQGSTTSSSGGESFWSKEASKDGGGLLGSPATGAMIGSMLSRSMGSGIPKTNDELVEDAWMDLESPEHQNEIRKIRVHAMLNSMMTDPDDPISSYEPDKVLAAYNEIAQLAPRAAEQPAVIKPLLRRRLAGNIEPFEAKEVADIEKGLTAIRLPTPNTSLKENPILAQALIGSAAGAGIGGIGTMFNNMVRKRRDRKSVIGNALTGALAGAGLGAGVGAARSGILNLSNSPGLAEGRDIWPGTFEMDGQQFQISPDALRKNPELLHTVKDLTTSRPLPQRIVGNTVGALDTVRKALPWTGTAAALVAPIDFMLHNPLFGINKIDASQATGRLGRDILTKGVTSTDLGKNLPEPIQKAIVGNQPIANGVSVAPHQRSWLAQRFGANPVKPTDVTVMDRVRRLLRLDPRQYTATDWLTHRRASRGRGSDNVLTVSHTPTEKVTQRDSYGNTASYEQPRPEATTYKHLTRATRDQLMREGAEQLASTQGRNLYRMRGTNWTYTGAKSIGGALGTRAALYGVPMFAAYGIKSYQDDAARQQSLQDIIRSLREQGYISEVPAEGGG